LDKATSKWVALVHALDAKEQKTELTIAESALRQVAHSIVALLGSQSDVKAAAVSLTAETSTLSEVIEGMIIDEEDFDGSASRLPFQPLTFRDCAFYSRHLGPRTAHNMIMSWRWLC